MSGRRVLILCYFYPPLAGGGVHRVLGFTRHLPRHGWDCTVVCAGPEDYWVRDETLAARVPRETEVIRVGGGSALSAWLRLRRGAAGKRSGRVFGGLRTLSDWWLLPDSYAGWARRARRVAEQRLARGDIEVVLSSSPPDSAHLAVPAPPWGGGAAGSGGRGHWVVDFRDPWIGLHFREPPTRLHAWRHAALERGVVRRASLVLAASRTHADDLERRFPPGAPGHPRVVHLPNGFEPDAGEAGESAAAPDPAHFVLAWTGTLSQMPDAEVFLEALHDLFARRPEARRRIRATLAGPFDADVADRAVALGLTGIVSFPGPLAHADARALQRAADLLLLWKPRGYRTMVPGKLYEYLDAGRPLLAVLDADDECAALVRRAGGTVAPARDRAALADEIEGRYLAWRADGRAPDRRPAWLEEHTRSALSARLAGLLDDLVTPAGRTP
ncbi:MAG: hypothetical protein HZC42_04685 [Candidatus Eisenbacteria bacterium]|nr:hypothetical protein [Candidatus Eisenbacteria bacterium]